MLQLFICYFVMDMVWGSSSFLTFSSLNWRSTWGSTAIAFSDLLPVREGTLVMTAGPGVLIFTHAGYGPHLSHLLLISLGCCSVIFLFSLSSFLALTKVFLCLPLIYPSVQLFRLHADRKGRPPSPTAVHVFEWAMKTTHNSSSEQTILFFLMLFLFLGRFQLYLSWAFLFLM